MSPKSKKNTKSGSALLAAIRNHQFDAARALIASGADVHHKSSGDGQNVSYETADLCNSLCTSSDRIEKSKVPGCIEVLRALLAAGGKVIAGPLRNAAAFGNAPLVNLLLEFGTDVNELDDGNSAFDAAIMFGQEGIAIELLHRGADPWAGAPISGRGPALLEAVVAELTMTVRACVEMKVDLNRRGDVAVGDAPPMTAVKVRDASGAVVSTKFTVHPPPMARNSTALIVATRCGHREIVELLVRGSDLEAADADGFTPMGWAIKSNRIDLVDVLRAAGAKEPENLDGVPLFALIKACETGNIAGVRDALARGVDVNAVYDSGSERFTALMHAARGGHAEIVDELLQSRADPNQGGDDVEGWLGISPLMLAAQSGHVEVVKRLLRAGADLDAEKDHILRLLRRPKAKRKRRAAARDDLAVHQAAGRGQAEVMKLLLEAGATKNRELGPLQSVVEAAAASGNASTLKAALAAKKKSGRVSVPSASVLVNAVQSGNQEAVRVLLAARADVNGTTRRGDKPLFSAVHHRDHAMVQLLLEAGAKPKANHGKPPLTELMAAAASGAADIVKLLLDAGANPDVRGRDGNTAVHLAAIFGFPDAVQSLINAGASTTVRNNSRRTPLEQVSKVIASWGEAPADTMSQFITGWAEKNTAQHQCQALLQRAAINEQA